MDTVTREMTGMLGLRGRPVMTRVFRWPAGTPQLEVGHLGSMDAVEAQLAQCAPGLYLVGRRDPQHRHPRLGGRGYARRPGRGGGTVRPAAPRALALVALLAALWPPSAQAQAPPPTPQEAQAAPQLAPAEPPSVRSQPARRGHAVPSGNHVAGSVVYVQVYRSRVRLVAAVAPGDP